MPALHALVRGLVLMLTALTALAWPPLTPNVLALNNGVGRLPPMGWNSWNQYGCNVSEKAVLAAADGLVASGMAKLGYVYVNVDDCEWKDERDAKTGRLVPSSAFPRGMKWLGDELHKRGLKFGLYTDRGDKTCQKKPGSKGHEKLDAATFASWGVDFLKEDSCYTQSLSRELAVAQYAAMRDALNSTGRRVFFSLCGWFPYYASDKRLGTTLGNSWRINQDILNFNGVYASARWMERLVAASGPGGWNDPDLLLGSEPGAYLALTPRQSRTQFSLWCVMAAPLLLSSSVRPGTWDFETYSNALAVRVNQDKFALPGFVAASTCIPHVVPAFASVAARPPPLCTQVWAKRLSDGRVALVLVNWDGSRRLRVGCGAACLARAAGDVGVSVVRVEQVYPNAPPLVKSREELEQASAGAWTWTAKGGIQSVLESESTLFVVVSLSANASSSLADVVVEPEPAAVELAADVALAEAVEASASSGAGAASFLEAQAAAA